MLNLLIPAVLSAQTSGSIRVPCLLPGCRAAVVQRRYTRPAVAGQELDLYCNGKEIRCYKPSDLAGHFDLRTAPSALRFCRFISGVDSNYLLGDHYREVIRKRDENEVYFQPTKHRFEMASGVEAIVSDRDFAMLRIHSPTVVRSSTGWVVTRTCFSDSRPKDVIELVEERVSFRGDYHRKVLWQYDPPQDIHLWIMYEQ